MACTFLTKINMNFAVMFNKYILQFHPTEDFLRSRILQNPDLVSFDHWLYENRYEIS